MRRPAAAATPPIRDRETSAAGDLSRRQVRLEIIKRLAALGSLTDYLEWLPDTSFFSSELEDEVAVTARPKQS